MYSSRSARCSCGRGAQHDAAAGCRWRSGRHRCLRDRRLSVCTTNPTLGRGLTLALTGAVDLVETIDRHSDDWRTQALALDALAGDHIVPFYEDQAAIDSERLAILRHTVFGAPAPTPPPASDRITFGQLRTAAQFDPVAFRAFWSVMGMLGRPDEVYADAEVIASTRTVLEHASVPPMVQPTRDQLMAALAT
jgi:hypothetical protein